MTHEEQIKWMADQITKLEGQYKSAMDTTAMLVGKMQPRRTWVGLTDEEIGTIEDEYIVDYRIPAGSAWNFAQAIEAKLKEKNT